jgi:predicted nucleic acid-binding protein
MAKKKIALLCSHIHVASTSADAVLQTINDVHVLDFEDGLEYYSAKEAGCQAIITENKEDFYFSEIAVMNCRELLKRDLLKTYTP